LARNLHSNAQFTASLKESAVGLSNDRKIRCNESARAKTKINNESRVIGAYLSAGPRTVDAGGGLVGRTPTQRSQPVQQHHDNKTGGEQQHRRRRLPLQLRAKRRPQEGGDRGVDQRRHRGRGARGHRQFSVSDP
jgi:hypothetical protein